MSTIDTPAIGPRTVHTVPSDTTAAPALPPSDITAPRRAVFSASRAARQIQGRQNPTLQLAAPVEGAACARTAAPTDGPRRLVVSHPFDATGQRSSAFEVLDVSPTGAISRPGRTFELGNATNGRIAFTPDGQVGLVALEDGKIGVFRLDAQGQPTVVHAGFVGSFTASSVVVEPSGDRALVIDRNWRQHGGGIYRVAIGCDGSLTDEGQVLPAKGPGAVAFAGNRALVAAADAGPAPTEQSVVPDNVHLFDLTQPPARVGSAEAFGNDQVVFGGAALTSDGKTFLVGDINQFGDYPNQVAAVDVRANGLRANGSVEVADPEAIAASPFGDVAVVTSPLSDSIHILDRGGPDGAWRVRGQVPYSGWAPQLPGDVATIDQGQLRGHLFVSENVSVRHLAFKPDGSVVDLGSFEMGKGLANINGAIGVTR